MLTDAVSSFPGIRCGKAIFHDLRIHLVGVDISCTCINGDVMCQLASVTVSRVAVAGSIRAQARLRMQG